jgi:RNA polymerase sigma-70 factor (ECF subfamily)
LANLVRLLGDFDLAEEAVQEAFLAATTTWPNQGTPAQPIAWLVSTGRHKAIDIIRRRERLKELQPELQARWERLSSQSDHQLDREIPDDRLRLIFACCHPAIDPLVQIPLTLREVCGLSTEEIASAFIVPTATMAQRIVRGKAKIRDAKIPIEIPWRDELPSRLQSILTVIYLVYNEGYAASRGDQVQRVDFADEAIRLARLVWELMPAPKVGGLLGLMLLHESRRVTREDDRGDLVLLEDQDRSRWDQAMITEGIQYTQHALRTRQFGPFTIQAAIAAVHAEARDFEHTDWRQITALYQVLQQISPSPVVELNWAVALAMRDGPQAGLELIESRQLAHKLPQYHLLFAARGDFYRRLGWWPQALVEFTEALKWVQQAPERRFLEKRRQEMEQHARATPAEPEATNGSQEF